MCVGLGLAESTEQNARLSRSYVVSAEVRDTCHRLKHTRPNLQQNPGIEITTIIFITTSNTAAVTKVAARACSRGPQPRLTQASSRDMNKKVYEREGQVWPE